MASHSSTLAWKIPWTEGPGRLQSMESLSQIQLSDFTFTFHFHALGRKWQPPPVFLPGESQGRGSLVGCRLWGRTELDTTEATQQQQQQQQPTASLSYPIFAIYFFFIFQSAFSPPAIVKSLFLSFVLSFIYLFIFCPCLPFLLYFWKVENRRGFVVRWLYAFVTSDYRIFKLFFFK